MWCDVAWGVGARGARKLGDVGARIGVGGGVGTSRADVRARAAGAIVAYAFRTLLCDIAFAVRVVERGADGEGGTVTDVAPLVRARPPIVTAATAAAAAAGGGGGGGRAQWRAGTDARELARDGRARLS